MPTVASGSLSLSKDRARALVASCSTFITDTGAANAGAAYSGFTYRNSLPAPTDGLRYTKSELQDYRPFALAFLDEDQPYSIARLTESFGGTVSESGTVFLAIERDVASGDKNDLAEAETKFANFIGDLIGDMIELAGTDDGNDLVGDGGTFLYPNSIDVVLMERVDEDVSNAQGDFYLAILAIGWGTSS